MTLLIVQVEEMELRVTKTWLETRMVRHDDGKNFASWDCFTFKQPRGQCRVCHMFTFNLCWLHGWMLEVRWTGEHMDWKFQGHQILILSFYYYIFFLKSEEYKRVIPQRRGHVWVISVSDRSESNVLHLPIHHSVCITAEHDNTWEVCPISQNSK